MATIPAVRPSLGASVTPIELTGTDDLAQKTGTLWLHNTSASPVTINIDGDGGTTTNTQGAGIVDVSGGYDVSVAVDALVPVPLTAIAAYLSGTVAVSGGTAGVYAYIAG